NFENGKQFLLRFYEKNLSGMAIDSLRIQFSENSIDWTTASNKRYNIYPHYYNEIINNIPDENSNVVYNEPTTTDSTNWKTILTNFYSLNDEPVNVSDYGYQAVELFDQTNNKTYYVLRKNNTSTYYWGTYMFCQNAANPLL